MSLFSTIRDVRRLESELLAARAAIASLESKLEQERAGRLEDTERWADRFLQKQGLFGLAPAKVAPVQSPPPPQTEPTLTAYEESVLAAYEEAARAENKPAEMGAKVFWARKLGKPDPFELPSDGQVEFQL